MVRKKKLIFSIEGISQKYLEDYESYYYSFFLFTNLENGQMQVKNRNFMAREHREN